MTIVYTTPCTMLQVVEKDGLYYPQERIVSVAGFGRLRNAAEVAQFEDSLINIVRYGPFHGFYGGYKQFGSYKGDKSFKSEKGAIAFVNRCSENLQGE